MKSNVLFSLSSAELRRAARIREKIAGLEADLAKILGGAPVGKVGKRRKMSRAARARIAAAQRERWKRVHAAKAKG